MNSSTQTATLQAVQAVRVPWHARSADLRRLAREYREALPESERDHSDVSAMADAAAASYTTSPTETEKVIRLAVMEHARTPELCDLADAILQIVSSTLIPVRLTRTHLERRAS